MSDVFPKLFTEDGEREVVRCDVCGRQFEVGDRAFINELFNVTLCEECYEEEDGYQSYRIIGEPEMLDNAF